MDKKSYCSKKQKESLIELLRLEENADLISGKFTQNFTYKDAERKWQNIAAMVNAIPGSRKDWKQWRKTWQDIRAKTKKRKSQHNLLFGGTGGGPKIPDLTDADENILELMSPRSISGYENTEETLINFNFSDGAKLEVIEDIETHEMDNQTDHQNYATLEPGCSTQTSDKGLGSGVISTPVSKPSKGKKRRTVASNRLQTSVEASQNLVIATKEKNVMKRIYYEKKLSLLERQTVSFEKIAASLETK